MQSATDTRSPVCDCVNRLSGGLAGAQRAGFFACLWVFLISITLMQPKLCATRTLTYTNVTNKAGFKPAGRMSSERTAEAWPS